MFFPYCCFPGCRASFCAFSQWRQLLAGLHCCCCQVWAEVKKAKWFPDNPDLCSLCSSHLVWLLGKNCIASFVLLFQGSGWHTAGSWYISTYVNSSFPRCRAADCAAAAEGIAFVQFWKFRSPVVLQHSDIILASILRIASPRNVGGSWFFLLVLSLHLHLVSISSCKVRLPSPLPRIIAKNWLTFFLKWRQIKVIHVSWMKAAFTLSDFYSWYLLTSVSFLMPRKVGSVL